MVVKSGHDDDTDLLVTLDGDESVTLRARISELENDLRVANESTLVLLERAATLARQVERLARLERAARKVYAHPGYHPNHLGECAGVMSEPSCSCGLADLRFAVRAMDAPGHSS